jgi:hypothetical protein
MTLTETMRRGIAVLTGVFLAAPAGAQGSLSVQGFGYPSGELSTRALGVAGSLADFDANSPINPAALLVGTRAIVYLQYDPEFRSVAAGGSTANTVTARFPLFLISGKVGQARFSFSYSSFLDRTWTNTYQDSQRVGSTVVPSTVTATSDGGIADVRGAMSYTISPRLTVGLGVHVFPGENRIIFGRSFPQDTVEFGSFAQTNTFNYSGAAVSYGIVATPIDHINLGVSGRYGFSMHVHQGDSTTLGDARVPNRISISGAYDGIGETIISARYQAEGWSAMRGLGSPGLSIFDSREAAVGVETSGPKMGGVPIAVRLGYRDRGLPFGVGPLQVTEREITGGLGLPFSAGRTALDISIAHAARSAPTLGTAETGWILSVGIAIKPY